MSDWLDRVVFWGLLAAVCLAPWLFGSVENYAVDALGLLLLSLLALSLLKRVVDRRFTIVLTPVHYALLAFLLLGLIQIVPLPWTVHMLPGLPVDISALLPLPDGRSLSLDPPATLRATIKLAILIGYFFIAVGSLSTPKRLSVAIHACVLLGVVVAIVGILHQLTSNDRILWIRASEFAGGSFGPFVNRNHFAGFIELLFPLPVAMIFSRGVSRDRWVLYGFCGVTMACAAVYSLSRGGLLSLGVQIMLIPILAERERRRRSRARNWEAALERRSSGWLATAAGIVLLSAAVGLGVIWIGAEPLMTRWAGTRAELLESHVAPQSRPATWWIALRIFRHHPAAGVGLGAFPRAYPMFDDSPGVYYVGEAHNDYLQVLSDTGAAGGLIGLAFLWFLASRVRRSLSSPSSKDRAAVLGAAVGACGILVHSLVDFNLQITSNGLMFLMLVAIIVSVDLRNRGLNAEHLDAFEPDVPVKLVKAIVVK